MRFLYWIYVLPNKLLSSAQSRSRWHKTLVTLHLPRLDNHAPIWLLATLCTDFRRGNWNTSFFRNGSSRKEPTTNSGIMYIWGLPSYRVSIVFIYVATRIWYFQFNFNILWFAWALLMAHTATKLKRNGDKAVPLFRPFWVGNVSDK